MTPTDVSSVLTELRTVRDEVRGDVKAVEKKVDGLATRFENYRAATERELGALRERSGVFGFLGGIIAFAVVALLR